MYRGFDNDRIPNVWCKPASARLWPGVPSIEDDGTVSVDHLWRQIIFTRFKYELTRTKLQDEEKQIWQEFHHAALLRHRGAHDLKSLVAKGYRACNVASTIWTTYPTCRIWHSALGFLLKNLEDDISSKNHYFSWRPRKLLASVIPRDWEKGQVIERVKTFEAALLNVCGSLSWEWWEVEFNSMEMHVCFVVRHKYFQAPYVSPLLGMYDFFKGYYTA